MTASQSSYRDRRLLITGAVTHANVTGHKNMKKVWKTKKKPHVYCFTSSHKIPTFQKPVISDDCVTLPAECFSHACIFDVLVCSEALDEHCDHLHRDVLHQTGKSNRWVKRRVCKRKNHGGKLTQLHQWQFSFQQ